MKTSKLLALSFLLIAFTTFSLPGALADDKLQLILPPVLDIFGNPLTTDSDYYIYGVPYGTNHTNLEVTLASESSYCPRRLQLSAVSYTQRVSISHAGHHTTGNVIDHDIRVGTYLNFRFNFSLASNVDCTESSTKWKVYSEPAAADWFVTIGGHAFHDRFQIHQVEGTNNYKLVYCPRPEPSCDCPCVGIGYKVLEDGGLYLTPNNEPFHIAFGQAENVLTVPPE